MATVDVFRDSLYLFDVVSLGFDAILSTDKARKQQPLKYTNVI